MQVVATIHQPNSQITHSFDDLLLLASGSCIYFGPWQSSVPYFAAVGHTCPLYTNPSDFFLSISKGSGTHLATLWAEHYMRSHGSFLKASAGERSISMRR